MLLTMYLPAQRQISCYDPKVSNSQGMLYREVRFLRPDGQNLAEGKEEVELGGKCNGLKKFIESFFFGVCVCVCVCVCVYPVTFMKPNVVCRSLTVV
jgi:hypothetical protein